MKPFLSKYSNSVMTLVMLAVFAVLVGVATGYPGEARFMPFVVGIPAILLCLLQLVLDAGERRRAAEAVAKRSDVEEAQERVSLMAGRQVEFDAAGLASANEPEMPPAQKVRRELVLWGYFVAFIGGTLLFGFWAAIPIFVVAFLRFQAKSSWSTSLILGLGASIVLFLVFEHGLKVQLHRGFVVSYVLDHMDR